MATPYCQKVELVEDVFSLDGYNHQGKPRLETPIAEERGRNFSCKLLLLLFDTVPGVMFCQFWDGIDLDLLYWVNLG